MNEQVENARRALFGSIPADGPPVHVHASPDFLSEEVEHLCHDHWEARKRDGSLDGWDVSRLDGCPEPCTVCSGGQRTRRAAPGATATQRKRGLFTDGPDPDAEDA